MKLKYWVAGVGLGLCCTAVITPVYLKLLTPSPAFYGQIYITAAHIDSTQFNGLKLMYADEDRDTAYYLREDYEYHMPEIGETVYFGNDIGVVEDYEEGVGFYIKIGEEVLVYQGMSGTRVTDKNGNEIAFIASLKGKNHLLCVSLY